MKNKTKKSGKIRYISVSRLYNLGNYQNVKYDLSAEVAQGEDAAETFKNLFWILKSLAPLRPPPCMLEYEMALRKTETERSVYEKEHMKDWVDAVTAYSESKRIRDESVKLMSDLGGTSKFNDAKMEWGDEDTQF